MLSGEDNTGGVGCVLFDEFVSGAENRLACAAARRVAEEPGHAYNPLFLHAGTGLGKTYLLSAIMVSRFAQQPTSAIRFLTAEEFIDAHYLAVKENRLEEFRNDYSALDMLLLDEVHRLDNNPAAQNTLTTIFNNLYSRGKQIVFASLLPPTHISHLREGLASRMQWGLVVEIELPEYALREEILRTKAERMEIPLSQEVTSYLAEILQGNVRELEGVLHRLHSHATLLQQTPDLALAHKITRDYRAKPTRRVTLDDIRSYICRCFDVSNADLLSRTRVRSIAYPRQIGMYLAHCKTTLSLEDIGKQFGGRDHSTVKHGCEKIRKLCDSDPAVRELIREFDRDFNGEAMINV